MDVLVLDLKFKLDYALSQISDIRRLYPDIEIVVLTMYEARYFALPLFKENIKAFLDKREAEWAEWDKLEAEEAAEAKALAKATNGTEKITKSQLGRIIKEELKNVLATK